MLEGKKGIIFGIANDHSIAWGIAKKLSENNAKLAVTYQNDTLKTRVEKLSESYGVNKIIKCDVSNSKDLDELYIKLKKDWGSLDFIVHSIAYSDKKELSGDYRKFMRKFYEKLENSDRIRNLQRLAIFQGDKDSFIKYSDEALRIYTRASNFRWYTITLITRAKAMIDIFDEKEIGRKLLFEVEIEVVVKQKEAE